MRPEQKLNQTFGETKQRGVPNDRTRECSRRILKLGNGNASVLADCLMAYKRDNPGIAHSSLATNLLSLVRFTQKVNKPFVDMKREDVLGYLDSLEKPESLDPAHKWEGFYNAFEITVTRFFKWFYYPDIDADDRPKPVIVAGFSRHTKHGDLFVVRRNISLP